MTKHDPDFCRRVAEAVGLPNGFDEIPGEDIRCIAYRNESWDDFRPDVDWNDAVFAWAKSGAPVRVSAEELLRKGPAGLCDIVLENAKIRDTANG